jgi:hypothetical protein
MKGFKGNRSFYISVGVLVVALGASAFFYRKEAGKAKQVQKEVEDLTSEINVIRNSTPTDEHKRFLEKQKIEIEDNYRTIVNDLLQWNLSAQLTAVPAAIFVGDLRTTVGIVATAAARKQIVIDAKARNLGFDEFERVAPGPEEDILQLQRELSAVTDIAMLLIASDVYSIDYMARWDEALGEEGQTGVVMRGAGEATTITPARRRRSKLDMYDTVPFRVKFTCKYPSLATFMRSLSAPKGVVVEQGERKVTLPRNFLVVNDLRFRVKEAREEGAEVLRAPTTVRGRPTTWALVPEDMPSSLASVLLARGTQEALMRFSIWRRSTPEQKRLYVLENRLREQMSTDEKQRLLEEYKRLSREQDERTKLQGQGRPPEYSTITVSMLIDFVKFTDKVKAELETGKAKGKPAASVSTGSQ